MSKKKKKDAADTLKEQGPEEVRTQVDDLERQREEEAEAARKEQEKLKEEAERKKEAKQILEELNRDNCVVLDGSKTLVLRFERDERNIGGERYTYYIPTFLRFADFRNLYLNRKIEVGLNKKGEPIIMDIGGWWLGHRKRRQYRGVTFVPAGPAVIDGRLNLWRGWGIEPKQGDWSLMKRHIEDVLAAGDPAVNTYILNWLAWTFQHPDQQAEAAPTFLSDGRGTGKGTVARGLCRIFGQHGIHISSPDQLTGKFNDHLRQCCFLFADEAYGPKDKSTEGQLKRLVTEDTIHIEPKGRGQFDVPNCLHIMFASNLDWVVPAGPHERRWVVQRVSENLSTKGGMV
jgi:Family of unknown function (DUF5906)